MTLIITITAILFMAIFGAMSIVPLMTEPVTRPTHVATIVRLEDIRARQNTDDRPAA